MIIGIDLAAKEHNKTGISILSNSKSRLKILYSNERILNEIRKYRPKIVAIDAPLSIDNRVCDKNLKFLGVMPLKLPSMVLLAKRAIYLVEQIKQIKPTNNITFIEVFPTGTSKILNIYSKNIEEYKNNIQTILGIELLVNVNKHLIDAFMASITGFLFQAKMTCSIGDDNGTIVIPNRELLDKILDLLRNLKIKIEIEH